MNEFVLPMRVYYEDTDSGGVVYHANYLKFMERARTEWLRSQGFEQDALLKEQGLLFAVRSLRLDYLRPGRFNDWLKVHTHLLQCRKASLTFSQTVQRGEESALCQAEVKVACLDAQTFRPRPIPKLILAEITGGC
ncbi:tol-pal system-associated acyl-CoA thioesterase [Nitrosococcus halophilus Nc 4]|uniref:Tol-pal system-associated acyl-CoA thioesterase n=1 Tax=Nitrosococcus halophilus (strain Nc4) TaxID=472759 RepID=D5C4W6_NITHN|nr:tol-pal system-associated acyl-CoA thioesterase [Nitrosococcus halophilus]ADE13389.1 tol-pal system-associated acyl-CoA thioesterase [Nitrosococcus halophilus Nc 4]